MSERGLPPEGLRAAFPCHLWLDQDLQVIQVGPLLERLVPGLSVGAPAFGPLTVVRPLITPILVTLRESSGEPIVLADCDTQVRLRGQVLNLSDGSLLLLLNPWVTEWDQLARWGLSLDDFPVHSAMPEQLERIRELRDRVAESTAMAEFVEAQRRALLESQHRIASHLRNTPLAVIDWDSSARIAAWNPAAARIFGIPAEDAVGRGTEVLGIVGLTRDNTTVVELPPRWNLLTTLHRRVVVEHHTPAGAKVLCAWHNTPLVDLEGQSIGVSSILRDVTESVRAERSIREAQKFESLGLLAGGVAHDFNNMLAALLGNAELALLEAEPSSPLARRLDDITQIAERASMMTKQLLDYSGRATYELEAVSLTEVVAEIRAVLAVRLGAQTRLFVREDPGLPDIHGDARQLREVLLNLIVNAAEAIGDRGGKIRVRTGIVSYAAVVDEPGLHGGPLAPGTYVRLEVSDDGVGMSEDLLSRIFDPFFSTKFTGRGLGLAAMLGIVRGHRGGLFVTSTPGEGTRFVLLFPATEPAANRPEPVVARLRRGPGRGRLLIVDDEAPVRRVLTTALAGAGFDVVTAEAGNTALALYDADPTGFDLVLTDLTMPGLDGHQLFTALTARDPRLPVILSSGYSDHQGTACYPDGTPATFLKKPYRLGYLLAKVDEELGKRAG